jgi:hypothetical protein
MSRDSSRSKPSKGVRKLARALEIRWPGTKLSRRLWIIASSRFLENSSLGASQLQAKPNANARRVDHVIITPGYEPVTFLAAPSII